MKKKILVFTLVAALLIGLVSVISLTTLTVSADPISPSSSLAGAGTQSNPYKIGSVADWLYFANLVNGTTQPAGSTTNLGYFQLTADITFNEGNASGWGSSAPAINLANYGGVDYTIGNVPGALKAGCNPFVGTLDGAGHTISGVYINKTGGSCGLFASTAAGSTATIKNLIITNSYYESDSSGEAGALIGQVSGGTTYIENVFVTDSVYIKSAGTSNGGILGHCGGNDYGDPTVYISNSVNGATVNAGSNQYVGGLIGNGNGKQLYINNCLNYGSITGGSNYVAGIVGRDDKAGSQFNYCVNIGTITPSSGTNYRQIVMSNSSSKKPILTNCLSLTNSYGKNTTNNNCATITASDFITAGFLSSDNGQKIVAGENEGKWVELSSDSESGGVKTVVKEICVPAALKDAVSLPKTIFYSYKKITHAPSWVLNAYDDESGIIEISTVKQYKEFADFFNGNNIEKCEDKMQGKKLVLTADLVFNTGDAAIWGTTAPENDMTSYMIGSWDNPFMGNFDGQGHTISGFYGKKVAGLGDTLGLFGSTTYGEESTLENLLITNSYFECGDGCVAALIGQVYAGTTYVNNIYVDESVYIYSAGAYAGGIVAHLGQGSFDTPSLYIDSCVNAAKVTSTNSAVGGILGNGNQKIYSVTNCLNMGDITGSKSVGGIVGYGRAGYGVEISVEYCVNTGVITSASSTNAEKACAIVSFGPTARDTLNSYGCYYLTGTSTYGVFEGSGESADGGASIISLTRLCRATLPANLDENDWIARGDDSVSPKMLEICIPKGVAEFAPQQTKYYGPLTIPEWLQDYDVQEEFEIDSVERFKEFADFVNDCYGDFEGKTVKLTADLDFDGNDMTKYMVGTMDLPFAGTFDGQGHVISGFYAKKTDGSDTAGIFGTTSGGKETTVKNFVITNSYFEANGAVGAVVGQTSGGATYISGVYVTDSVYIVSNNSYAGGIVGHVGQNGFNFINGKPAVTIDSCANAAKVTAPTDETGTCVGGILGNANNKNVTIKKCLNMGDVSGYNNVGGILGNGTGGTTGITITVDGCINIGDVSAVESNASAIANLSDKGTRSAKKCYYLSGTAANGVVSGQNNSVEAVSLGDLMSGEIEITGWEARTGEITDDEETGIRTIANRDIMIPAALSEIMGATPFCGTIYVVIGATGFASGDGSEETPYVIETAAEWQYFANRVKAGETFEGKFIVLAADITISYENPVQMRVVGTAKYPFAGNFDGQGHALSGFNVNSENNGDKVGIFGVVKAGATIKNVILKNSELKTTGSGLGFIAAVLADEADTNTVIENIYVGNDVYYTSKVASDWNSVGGILGTVIGDEAESATVEISNCVFGGKINSSNGSNTYGVGGIVGNGNGSKLYLYNCLNFGEIKGKNYTAGLVGINEGKTHFERCANAVEPESEIWNSQVADFICATSISAKIDINECLYVGQRGRYTETLQTKVSTSLFRRVDLKYMFRDMTNLFTDWIAREDDIALPSGVEFAAGEPSGLVIKDIPVVPIKVDPNADWNGEVATSFAGGNGSDKNPFQISNAAQFAYFASYAKSNPGKYYVLTSNIVFNKGNATTWGTSFNGINTTPFMVGDWENPFVGTFDGQGYTVSGFYAKTSGDGGTGIFGCVANHRFATIKNLVIDNSYFESDCTVAAVAGQVKGGKTTFENVYVTSLVRVVCGKYGKNNDAYAGGILGHVSADASNALEGEVLEVFVNNCVNGAPVTAAGRSVGGIVGNGNGQKVYVTDCINIGNVKGANYVCGIVGYDANKDATVTRCVNLGTVSGSSSSQITRGNGSNKPVVTDCIALNSSFGENISGESSGNVVIEKNDFISAGFLSTDAGKKIAATFTELSSKTVNEGETIFVSEICIPTSLKDVIKGNLPMSALYSKSVLESAPEWLVEGYENGTIEINTVQQYKEFIRFFNGEYAEKCANGASGITVKLTADLVFNKGNASTWGTTAPENDMTPYILGSWDHPFCGTFDGQGHIISGFYAKKTGSEDTVGIIGCTAYGKEATVQNLVITNSYFESEAGTVAACVAQTEGGVTTIKNIYVTDSVYVISGNHYAGGIIAHVGQGSFSTPELIVDSCVNEATVTATGSDGTSVGGIVGNGNQKIVTITNCLNTGNVSGYRYVGGILGFGKGSTNEIVVSRCVNAGTITAEYTGGENGKACAIVGFGDKEQDMLVAEDCYYVSGTATYGVFIVNGEVEGAAIAVADVSELTGFEVDSSIVDTLTEWVTRDEMIIIPKVFADVELVPEEIEDTEPVETDPVETEPITEPVTDPITEPITEPVTDPATEPGTEPSAEQESSGCAGCNKSGAASVIAVFVMAFGASAIIFKKKA